MELDDIDRIEVVRGGSTTTWGANSLNGVINIITKKSQYTQNNLASIFYGNNERGLEYRYGGGNGNNIFYRVFAERLGAKTTTSDTNEDTLKNYRYGAKLDLGYDITDDFAAYFTNGFASMRYKINDHDRYTESKSVVSYF